MMPDYANDADGDALRRVAGDGNDMNAPMLIDFTVVVPDETQAQRFASVAKERGFTVQIYQFDDDPHWDVQCSIMMIPLYDDLLRIQKDLNEWAAPFNGYSDGWGTFGNKPDS